MKRIITTLAAALIATAAVSAQGLETAYYLDGYTFGYRLNPSFMSERGFFALPGVSRLSIGAGYTPGLENILFVKDGKTVTFLNTNVTKEEFTSKMKGSDLKVHLTPDINILALGFWNGDAFHTFDVSLKANMAGASPYDLFRLLKCGTEASDVFDLSSNRVHGSAYLEAAFSSAFDVGDNLSIGYRIKGLAGLQYIDLNLSKMDLNLGREKWEIAASGDMFVSGDFLKVPGKYDEELGKRVVDVENIEPTSDFDIHRFRPAGYGGAVDIGATWRPFDFLSVSCAVLDLGGISWKTTAYAQTPDMAYTYKPAEDMSFETASESISDQITNATSALSSMLYMEMKEENGKGQFKMLPWSANVGVNLRAPFYDRISLGLLGVHRHGPAFNYNSARASLNWSLFKWFSISGSVAKDNLKTTSYGGAINFHPGLLNIFLGFDSIPTTVIPVKAVDDALADLPFKIPFAVGIPKSRFNTGIFFGVTLSMGQRHRDFAGRRYVKKVETESLPSLEPMEMIVPEGEEVKNSEPLTTPTSPNTNY